MGGLSHLRRGPRHRAAVHHRLPDHQYLPFTWLFPDHPAQPAVLPQVPGTSCRIRCHCRLRRATGWIVLVGMFEFVPVHPDHPSPSSCSRRGEPDLGHGACSPWPWSRSSCSVWLTPCSRRVWVALAWHRGVLIDPDAPSGQSDPVVGEELSRSGCSRGSTSTVPRRADFYRLGVAGMVCSRGQTTRCRSADPGDGAGWSTAPLSLWRRGGRCWPG